jgi:lipopolysaccharide biosynthesis glycosyltransferase
MGVSAGNKYCIATVSTENYFQWTMTMLFSFIQNNPWFTGDIIIICKDLPKKIARELKFFNNVILVEPSAGFFSKLDFFTGVLSQFSNMAPRFYSLEIFRLCEYEKILFLDSDMIVVQSVEELFDLPGAFYACPQLCWYKGKGRNEANFVSEYKNEENSDGFVDNPINTGLMLIDRNLLNSNHYDGLLELINPHVWNPNLTFTDEYIINKYFRKEISLLDTRYNYRARVSKTIREKQNIAFEEAKIIHYYANFKPWNFSEVLTTSYENLTWLKAYERWYQWYVEFLKFYCMQKKMADVKKKLSGKR